VKNNVRTVLFDLDGTLADTAPDLGFALNELLREHDRPALPFDRIRPVASHGARALIELGFGVDPDDPRFAALRTRFLEIYRANLTRETRLFPGMRELLDAIRTRGMNWGIVTNKPAFLTEPLVEQLGLGSAASAIVSGDTVPNRKPHPEPMLLACRTAGSNAAQCLYVGDAERDIAAGRNAGMKTLVALYGYIGSGEAPEKWGADGMVRRPDEILNWIART
jgi:phosphoglycolate phosphatase